jgi:hypothetical protein
LEFKAIPATAEVNTINDQSRFKGVVKALHFHWSNIIGAIMRGQCCY